MWGTNYIIYNKWDFISKRLATDLIVYVRIYANFLFARCDFFKYCRNANFNVCVRKIGDKCLILNALLKDFSLMRFIVFFPVFEINSFFTLGELWTGRFGVVAIVDKGLLLFRFDSCVETFVTDFSSAVDFFGHLGKCKSTLGTHGVKWNNLKKFSFNKSWLK